MDLDSNFQPHDLYLFPLPQYFLFLKICPFPVEAVMKSVAQTIKKIKNKIKHTHTHKRHNSLQLFSFLGLWPCVESHCCCCWLFFNRIVVSKSTIKIPSGDCLRTFIVERLAAAVLEIFRVIQQKIDGHKAELDYQHRLVGSVWRPK